MELKTKNINGKLFKKSLYLVLFIFFFMFSFSGSNAFLARAAECKGPADVVLAIDRSANMAGGTKFETVKNSSVDFIDNLFAIPPHESFYPYDYHQIGLAIFNNNITSENLTTDDVYIKGVVSSLEDPNSSCEVGLAVQKAQANLNANGNSEATKTIIILIAGPPDNLASAIEQVRLAKEAGTRVVSIGINLNELADPQKAHAESFITNDYINSYDCYYVSSDSDAALDGCTSISASDLSSSLNDVYTKITGAVCDEIAPELEIYRIPSGTLYNIDKLIITSKATDDVGFKSHSIAWSDDWPNDQREITDCSLVGKEIYCDTGEIGPFAVGKTINFGSSATDANDNVITIEPIDNAVKVATVSLTVPELFRNKNNKISVNVKDPQGNAAADKFYIRIDNGAINRVIDESDLINSEMTGCVGSGSDYTCYFDFNPGCASEGVYPNDTVDIYVYPMSGGVFHSGPIASSIGNSLALPAVSVASGNCTGGDTNCNGVIDSEEMLCDSGLPISVITRTDPVETSEVYDDDASITLKAEASDGDSTIERSTIFYRIVGDSEWTRYDCYDAITIDGKCDDDTSKSIANFSIVIDSIFPASAETVIEYKAEAVDSSGNYNMTTTPVKSFIVKNRECDGKEDLEDCAITPGGKCCGGVCNTSAENSGPFGPYNTDFCAELSCDGIVLKWVPNSFTGQCAESGDSDNCYSYTPDPLVSPASPPSPYDNNGCEEREYRCDGGYCNYGVDETRRTDSCDVFGTNPLVWRDFQCESGECKLIREWEDEQCDTTISFTDLVVQDGRNPQVTITGLPEVLDVDTDKIRITANVADPNGIASYKIYWQLNGGFWQEKDCGSCGSSTETDPCSCSKEIGPFEHGDFVNYYMWSQDSSLNQNEEYVGFEGGLKYDYYTYSSGGTDKKGTYKGSDIDTNPDHYWSSSIKINADNIWEDQNDAAMTWEGFIRPSVLGEYKIYAQSDDGIKLYIDDTEVINAWEDYLYDPHIGTYIFDSLNPVPIKIIWYDSGDSGRMKLGWLPPGETTETYPIPAANLIAPYTLAVRDSECYDINFDYTLSADKDDIETLCDSGNGICCGGYCDSSPSSTSYDEECRVNSCNGTNWVYAISNILGETKEGESCGSTDTCFDYYSPNSSFYSGCITGGNECSSGYCAVSSTLTSTPSCNGNLLTNYDCNPDNATGTCQPKDSNIDCSDTGDYDNDSASGGTACNCDCNGYDKEEKVYSSLSFDGVDDYVSTGKDLIGEYSGAIEVWANTKTLEGTHFISHNGIGAGGGPGPEVSFMQSGSYMYFKYYGGGLYLNAPIPAVDEWHHWVAVWDGTDAVMYMDGAVVDTDPWNGGPIDKTGWSSRDYYGFNIGTYFLGWGRNWYGSLDEMRVYNRALYPEEVQDHYNGIFADDTGLVGHWNFDEGSGETAYDYHDDTFVDNNNGTLKNGPKWMKYYHGSISGASGNVPAPWQVCTDGKDNDCDLTADDYIKESSGMADELGGANTLTDNDMSWIADEWQDGIIEIVSGTGNGQVRTVSSNTATAVTVDTDWDAGGIPDNTSEYNLIKMLGNCDGEVDSYSIKATAINNDNNLVTFSTPLDDDISDVDVSQAPNDFTLSATGGDDFGIGQILIEWTTDNWGTTNDVSCNGIGICEVCVIGGSCSNKIIDPSSLAADTVFTYRTCVWDNNNNKACTDDYSFIVLNSNSTPWLTDLEVIVPDFCESGLEYILSWKFNDDDILDKQNYYEAQVKEGDNDWTTGPFVINLLKYVTADNDGFSYHPIIKGENNEIGTAESSTVNTLVDNDASWVVDEWKGGTVEINSGSGSPQTKLVASNTEHEIFVNSWDINPGSDFGYEVKSVDLEYGEKKYYWRVRATDDRTGGYAKTSEWVEGDLFTTPAYKFPQIEFSANLDSDPGKDCFLGGCKFGEDIVFHDDTTFFVSCDNSDNKQCLSVDAAKCDVSKGQCVPCSGNYECNKFESPSEIQYFCNTESGICETPDSCVDSDAANNDDDNCKSADAAKCDADSGQCVACDNDLQCTDEKFDTVGIDYFCNNEGVCEDKKHRKWWFYGNNALDVDSTDPNPINNYVESVYDNYDVILKVTDITGEYCSKSKNIRLGGKLYPKWNEVSSSN